MIEVRVCSGCGKATPVDGFSPYVSRGRRYRRRECRPCRVQSEKMRRYRAGISGKSDYRNTTRYKEATARSKDRYEFAVWAIGLLRERGMTLGRIAEASGLWPETVSLIEKGKRRYVYRSTVEKLSAALVATAGRKAA